MATVRTPGALSKFAQSFQSFKVANAGYRKYGLKADDLLLDENEIMAEALRRLSPQERYARLFRTKRAMDCEMKATDLPRDQWTTPEEDLPYLKQHLERIKAEIKEKADWDAKYF
jgi:ubiquinol-cytochrome c reductase subunit 7